MKQAIAPEIKNGNGTLELLEKTGEGYENAKHMVKKALRALSVSLENITKDPFDTEKIEKVEEQQDTLSTAYRVRKKSHVAFQNARSRAA